MSLVEAKLGLPSENLVDLAQEMLVLPQLRLKRRHDAPHSLQLISDLLNSSDQRLPLRQKRIHWSVDSHGADPKERCGYSDEKNLPLFPTDVPYILVAYRSYDSQRKKTTVHDIDFLPVGDGKNSGDAIAIRFSHPEDGRWVHVIVDAGFRDDGEALVEHFTRYYETDHVDLAILTHPDGDHIGGMGEVVRGLNVDKLWLHDIGAHGGSGLPAAAAVKDLIAVAQESGAVVQEAWAGASAFGGALTILGPDRTYYEELVADQVERRSGASPTAKALVEAARNLWDRVVTALGAEIPFSEKDVSPRNDSSMITLLRLDGDLHLLTADAGVPALERAWDFAERKDLAETPHFVQVPHHGSRRNGSSAWLDRLLGGIGQPKGSCTAFISVVEEAEKHPSGRIVNAYIRRGCGVVPTAGTSICHGAGTPSRANWGPAVPLPPMEEEDD